MFSIVELLIFERENIENEELRSRRDQDVQRLMKIFNITDSKRLRVAYYVGRSYMELIIRSSHGIDPVVFNARKFLPQIEIWHWRLSKSQNFLILSIHHQDIYPNDLAEFQESRKKKQKISR